MNGKIFTTAFRQKLKRMVRTPSNAQAPMLAVKISPIFSILAAALILLNLEQYNYFTFALVLLLAVTAGALLAYLAPKVVLGPMHLLTLEPQDLMAALKRLRKE